MPSLPDRSAIARELFADETALVRKLAAESQLDADAQRRVAELARQLVAAVRAGRRQQGGIDAFMQEYSLSSEEGVVLMCLAEALLRIPDAATADKLIADKIGGKDWEGHLGQSESLFVNASAWGLMLTGKFVELGRGARADVGGYLKRLVSRSGEPVIRNAMKQAMRIMGKQFVLGRTIDEALAVAAPLEAQGYRFSYDMLGEAAFTMEDAERYFASYRAALQVLGAKTRGADVFTRASISVKLSALHPRYEEKQEARVMAELMPKAAELAALAKALNVGLTIDAEEVNRLDLSLELFGRLAQDARLRTERPRPGGAGLLHRPSPHSNGWRRSPRRQDGGCRSGWSRRLLGYRNPCPGNGAAGLSPVHPQGLDRCATSPAPNTIGTARPLLSAIRHHNAHSLAAISVMAGDSHGFEFQRLHGMGQALYEQVVGKDRMNQPCRIYAPVGSHEDLLAYLVRASSRTAPIPPSSTGWPMTRRQSPRSSPTRPSRWQACGNSPSANSAAGGDFCRPQKFCGTCVVGRRHAPADHRRHRQGAGTTFRSIGARRWAGSR
jgi:RHH-type proline utilization regulon transcriptional repressor/proline dehydrogenase/delta 1-pyrroline-5-carboxylate dehydrogenase